MEMTGININMGALERIMMEEFTESWDCLCKFFEEVGLWREVNEDRRVIYQIEVSCFLSALMNILNGIGAWSDFGEFLYAFTSDRDFLNGMLIDSVGGAIGPTS